MLLVEKKRAMGTYNCRYSQREGYSCKSTRKANSPISFSP
jgi:hypothetical protein